MPAPAAWCLMRYGSDIPDVLHAMLSAALLIVWKEAVLRDCWGLSRRQLYGFGGVSCVVDSSASVVRAHIGGAWVLASMEQLLVEARKRQRL